MRGRVRTVWVQGKGWKWVRRRTGGQEGAREGARMRGCKGKDGNGWGEGLVGQERVRMRTVRVHARTCTDAVGAREGLEMGGEKARWT